MPIDTKWFTDRLADQRMSQRGLARALGLDPAAVSLTLRGKREMKIAEAAAIARLLGVPADEVMEHAGVRISSKNTLIPLGGWMDGTAEVHVDMTMRQTVPHPGGDLPENAGACICRTDGTDLSHMDGWILYVANMNPDGGIQPESIGHLSFCRLKNGGIYVARIVRGMKRGRWTLHTPGGVMNDVEVEWTRPVLLVAP